jgi:cation transport ATPase
MEEICQARANKRCERELHIYIKEMHTHMREIELKEEEEEEEEELKQREEAPKKRDEELRIREEQLEKHKKKCVTSFHFSTLCVIISISMCCNPNLCYVPYFKFLCNYFLKFVIHKINYKIVKSRMMVLTRRENMDVTDADMTVD